MRVRLLLPRRVRARVADWMRRRWEVQVLGARWVERAVGGRARDRADRAGHVIGDDYVRPAGRDLNVAARRAVFAIGGGNGRAEQRELGRRLINLCRVDSARPIVALVYYVEVECIRFAV